MAGNVGGPSCRAVAGARHRTCRKRPCGPSGAAIAGARHRARPKRPCGWSGAGIAGARQRARPNGYGRLRRVQTFSSRRATSGRLSDAAKLSEPAAKTFAPAGVSVGQSRAREGPGRDSRARHLVPRLVPAVIRAHVLDAHERRLGPSQFPPERPANETLALPRHAPVEVVRCEEGEIAPRVPEALDRVVRVPRDVLLVAGEDEEVVAAREFCTAEALDVVVRQEVDALPGPVQPGDELEIPVVEPEWDAEVEERTL